MDEKKPLSEVLAGTHPDIPGALRHIITYQAAVLILLEDAGLTADGKWDRALAEATRAVDERYTAKADEDRAAIKAEKGISTLLKMMGIDLDG